MHNTACYFLVYEVILDTSVLILILSEAEYDAKHHSLENYRKIIILSSTLLSQENSQNHHSFKVKSEEKEKEKFSFFL